MRSNSVLTAGLLLITAATVSAQAEVLVGTDWAENIVSEREAISGRTLDPTYRENLVRDIAVMPAAQLENNLNGSKSEAAPPTNLLFNPVVPCRIIDTRNWDRGKLITGSPIRVFAAGLGPGYSYSRQGGSEADCGIPFGPAKAVMMNITTTQWDGRGNINAWPYHPSEPLQPLASVANFGAVTGVSAIANALSIAICDPAEAEDNCGGGDLFFQANGSGTHLVVDIMGYYSEAPSNSTPAQLEK